MFWKDTSAKIIPKALKEYFVNGIPVERTIYDGNNIHDFMYGVKGSKNFEMVVSSTDTQLQASEDEQHVPRKVTMVETERSQDEDSVYRFELVEQKIKGSMITNEVHDVRMLRYYAATEGSTLSKLWKEGTKKGVAFDSIQANTPVIVQQTIRKTDIHDYLKNGSIKIRYDKDNRIIHRFPNLDKSWYIKKCYEEIYNVIGEPS